MAILDSECQIALFTAAEESITHLRTINAICTELDLPLCVTNSLIIDATVLREIETNLFPHSGIAGRPRLLLAGSFLEEQITVCALHAVYVGFEVFLLKDFIVPKKLIMCRPTICALSKPVLFRRRCVKCFTSGYQAKNELTAVIK